MACRNARLSPAVAEPAHAAGYRFDTAIERDPSHAVRSAVGDVDDAVVRDGDAERLAKPSGRQRPVGAARCRRPSGQLRPSWLRAVRAGDRRAPPEEGNPGRRRTTSAPAAISAAAGF